MSLHHACDGRCPLYWTLYTLLIGHTRPHTSALDKAFIRAIFREIDHAEKLDIGKCPDSFCKGRIIRIHYYANMSEQGAEQWNARKEAAVGSGNQEEIDTIRNIENKVSGVENTLTHLGWGAGLKNADLKAIHESGKRRVLESIQALRDTGVETVMGEETEAWIKGRVHKMVETYRSLVAKYSDPSGPKIKNQEGVIADDKASLAILEDVEKELERAA